MKNQPVKGYKLVLLSLALSILFTGAALVAANDAFALVTDSDSQTVVLPEGASTRSVARILKENGMIRFPWMYTLYARIRGFGETYLSGEFTLNTAMSYDELRYALSPRRGVREQIRVTIPEGYTTSEIIALFVARGIGTEDGFREAIENGGNFGFDFVDEIPTNPERRHRLDGYLFPDTYFVYADSSEAEILTKLLAGFRKRFDEPMREDAKRAGFSVDEIVRLASVIQSEAYYESDMAGISAVFRNRLKNARYSYLESDATVKYVKKERGDMSKLTPSDLKTVDSPYNTYLYRGLPPGAICSPGAAALAAAIYPADTEDYYFVSGDDKRTIFSRTYDEHLRAVAGLRQATERKDDD